MGVLTADWRDSWASIRDELISSDPENANSLQQLDSALFVVVLEVKEDSEEDKECSIIYFLLSFVA